MLRPTLYRLAALAVLLGAPAAVLGQEPAPVSLRADSLTGVGSYNLTYAWRYHPGDDPRWADPAFDDRGWERVEPLLPPGEFPRDRWPGTAWFRRHLRVDPGLYGKTVTIRVTTPGATTVFLDGAPVMSTTAKTDGRPEGGIWQEVVLSPRPDHLLAVRHSLAPAGPTAGSGNLGFLLSIEPKDAAAFQLVRERRRTTVLILFTVVPAFLAAFLALLHLALFLSYRKARENLFYALAMAASAAIAACDLASEWTSSESGRILALRLVFCSVLALTFFILLTYYAVRTLTFPRTWVAFAAGGVALTVLTFLLPHPPPWIWYGYFGLVVIEVIRVEASGETVEREGVGILLRGFLILGAVIVLQVLMALNVVPPIAGVNSIYQFGLLAFEVAMSLFLARGFARTSLHLERRLDEVRALSEQVLAQERAAYELELGQRLLEAENRRKTSEIEEARALQLSMLPASLPAVEGLETAAAMITASEVGGDYYDFRIAADGSLVVAFGDAAGHGVAAGLMVTAVKALFSTLGGGESLPAVLAECDRVLRGMQARPLHMCLTLARVTPRAVTVCSAAMPPVLIHRAGSGEVEELGLGGRPIGSRLAGGWSERSAPLAPGDTLLFASDGFAEQLDLAEDPLGYERMAEALRAAAGLPVRDLVERLLAQVGAWRGEREQGDDVTFVAIRAS
jgi:serine phosphatase RsbU (regulator of sigma subunit)